MKNAWKKVLCLFAACALSLCFLCGCGGAPQNGTQNDFNPPVSQDAIAQNFRWFMGISAQNPDGDMGDRAPASGSERNAAQKLYNRFADAEAYPSASVTPLSRTEFTLKASDGSTRTSQNVEVRFRFGESGKRVIVGTGYDNPFGTSSDDFIPSVSTGAIESGTSVATLISLIDWCNQNADTLSASLDFDIVFVFFGCSAFNSMGARAYIEKSMEPSERLNTLLMVNIDRMGGERLYLYADEAKTEHETFLRQTASEQGVSVWALPDNMPLIDGMYIDGVYYTHFGMLGDHAPFIEWKIPSAYLFGGYYGGFNLSDLEVKGQPNLGGTNKDTFGNLLASRPAYAEQGSAAAALVLSALQKENFAQVMASSRASAKDYSFWVNPMWAYLIVTGLIIAAGIVLVVIVKRLEKKYPYIPQVKRMKIAVFGMEYETENDEDIFIDVRRSRYPFDEY